jgi:peptide/nickel transport system ATP-binding protein
MDELILEIKNLSIDYVTKRGAVRAVDKLNLNIERGDIVGIIGESGSGKTTLASGILQSLQKPGQIAEGDIIYHFEDGRTVNLTELKDSDFRKYRWTHISSVFQAAQNALNPSLKIIDHFIETVQAHDMDMTRQEITKKAKELMKQVRLEERVLNQYPHQLSGGMKQRTIIALSLILEPALILLDEPTTALDVITQWYILDILRTIKQKTGITMIFFTHDVSIIGSVVDKLGVMYSGQLVEYGPVDKVFKTPTHGYTEALMKAIPSLYDDVSKRKAIGGYPPNLLDLPKGCRFGPRCPYAQQGLCEAEKLDWINLKEVDTNQFTLCMEWEKVRSYELD